jgi:tetratricopeptide (TPR) repeat protein
MIAWCDLAAGRVQDGHEALERSLALARECSSRYTEMLAVGGVAMLSSMLGLYESALQKLDLAVELAHETGMRRWLAHHLALKGALLCDTGAREDGEEFIRQGIAIAVADRDKLQQLDLQLMLTSAALDDGDRGSARAAFGQATLLAADREGLPPRTRAQFACFGAQVSDGAGAVAAAALLAEITPRLWCQSRMDLHRRLWLASGESRHLAEARRALDVLVENAPEEYRESMLKNVRVHREIMEACCEHLDGGDGDGGDDDEPRGTESVTRVG